MKYTSINTAPIKSNPHGVESRPVLNTVHAQAVHLKFEQGQKLRRHITPVDVFFYILEGEGVVEVGDEQLEVTQGMVIESPKDIPHRIMNPSEGTLRVLVVKTPRPVKATQVL